MNSATCFSARDSTDTNEETRKPQSEAKGMCIVEIKPAELEKRLQIVISSDGVLEINTKLFVQIQGGAIL